MNRTWRRLMALLLAAAIALPGTAWADTGAEADYGAFAAEVVELYYRNKDLGEQNDLSPYTTGDALRLLNAKSHLNQQKLRFLQIAYRDYHITVQPCDTGTWWESDTEIYLTMAAKAQWCYTGTDDMTTRSDVQALTLLKNADGSFTVKACYDLYPGLYLGDIDTVYREALAAGETDLDGLLADYGDAFMRRLIQRENLARAGSSRPKPPGPGVPYLYRWVYMTLPTPEQVLVRLGQRMLAPCLGILLWQHPRELQAIVRLVIPC